VFLVSDLLGTGEGFGFGVPEFTLACGKTSASAIDTKPKDTALWGPVEPV